MVSRVSSHGDRSRFSQYLVGCCVITRPSTPFPRRSARGSAPPPRVDCEPRNILVPWISSPLLPPLEDRRWSRPADRIQGPTLGISRRTCLRIGGLTLGGLALPEILRAEAAAGARPTAKGVIMVVLPGGPSHLDTFDLKPDAPAEIRGEFRPIATRVPGIEICELLPRLARMADRLTLIRSLVGFRDDHNTHWCTTGWESHPPMDSSPDRPGISRRRLAVAGGGPLQAARSARARRPAVGRSDADGRGRAVHPADRARAAGLPGRGPRRVRGRGGRARQHHAPGIGPDRLSDRRALLAGFDEFRRRVDRRPRRRRESTSFSGRPSRS